MSFPIPRTLKRYKIFVLAAIILVSINAFAFRGFLRDWWWNMQKPELPAPTGPTKKVEKGKKLEETHGESFTPTETPIQSPAIEIPAEINLAVPFTSQSPFAAWDEVDEDLCEEAALVMVNRFYQGRNLLDKSDAYQAILTIKEWEEVHLGEWKSNSAEQVAQVAREMLGYTNTRTKVISSFDEVKAEVSEKRPVILPTAGRLLKNPNFRQPGPLYHMLVVRGWVNDGRIITNDPGTRKGEGYLYSEQVLWNAIHDWNNGNVYNGQKIMIVVK